MNTSVLNAALEAQRRGKRAAICTIVKTQGSTPLKAGASMLVRIDGSIEGTIGGGALEYSVIEQAQTLLRSNTCQLVEHQLVRDHQMCCGGTVSVFIEPLPVRDQVYLFGAGHVGKALASILTPLDFNVSVVDERSAIFNGWSQQSITLLNDHANNVLERIAWSESTYIVIATYSHALDREILRHCVKQPFRYCGMIGSQRKVKITRQLFVEQHWATPEELDRIDMPIGIDISAETPQELAISIAAKVIAVKRQHPATLASRQPRENSENILDTHCAIV